MLVVTTHDIPGQRIVKVVGLVKGNTIRARHLGRDIIAGLKNMVGGEISDYTKMIAECREEALDRMIAQAKANGDGSRRRTARLRYGGGDRGRRVSGVLPTVSQVGEAPADRRGEQQPEAGDHQ